LQPSSHCPDHRYPNWTLIWTVRCGQTIKQPTRCLILPSNASPVHAAPPVAQAGGF
jgi:hypothetical protein